MAAESSAGPLPAATRIKVTGLDGLVLTVEPHPMEEHVPASAPAEGGTTVMNYAPLHRGRRRS